MVHQPEPTKALALIGDLFASKGVKVQTKEAYELLAKLWGYRDWATFRAANPKKSPRDNSRQEAFPESREPTLEKRLASLPYGHLRADIETWPTWVLVNDTDLCGVETLKVLPFGATFANRAARQFGCAVLRDDDAVELTVGITDPQVARPSWQDLVAVTALMCTYPDANENGIPMFANEREVAPWLKDTIGWGYLADTQGNCLVDITASDTGDDSWERWWVEVRVHPDVHARLLTQFDQTA